MIYQNKIHFSLKKSFINNGIEISTNKTFFLLFLLLTAIQAGASFFNFQVMNTESQSLISYSYAIQFISYSMITVLLTRHVIKVKELNVKPKKLLFTTLIILIISIIVFSSSYFMDNKLLDTSIKSIISLLTILLFPLYLTLMIQNEIQNLSIGILLNFSITLIMNNLILFFRYFVLLSVVPIVLSFILLLIINTGNLIINRILISIFSSVIFSFILVSLPSMIVEISVKDTLSDLT